MEILDLRVGEAKIIRDAALRIYDLADFKLDIKDQEWNYSPSGYKPLADALSKKYNANVLITNGAMQGLHAAMYALRRLKCKKLGLRIPYWNRLPAIAKSVGIKPIPFDGSVMSTNNLGIDSYLLTLPNNPDGYIPPTDTLHSAAEILKEQKIPLIHDAAYYTGTYLPNHKFESIGDVQIFSASKMYGLSSLRLGYVVVYNASFYRSMLEYLELSSVGVSIASQKLFLHILEREEQMPWLKRSFENESYVALANARKIFGAVDNKKILLSSDYFQCNSVFAWAMPLKKNLLGSCKIEALPGDIFGKAGFSRINLGAGNDIITEAVKRINAA